MAWGRPRMPTLTYALTTCCKAPYLDYASALQKGWPIATGVIEGACRHLVKDRMDITGARRASLAARPLELRALRSNGDFPSYWAYHLAKKGAVSTGHTTSTALSPGCVTPLQGICTLMIVS